MDRFGHGSARSGREATTVLARLRSGGFSGSSSPTVLGLIVLAHGVDRWSRAATQALPVTRPAPSSVGRRRGQPAALGGGSGIATANIQPDGLAHRVPARANMGTSLAAQEPGDHGSGPSW